MRFYASLILLPLISACSTTQEKSTEAELEKAAIVRETKEEIMVGRGMAARLLGEYGLDDSNPLLTKYVNLVGQTVARAVGRPELKFHFAVLKTKEVNALACPGGFIFITRGLFDQIRSESELAAALAHEVAHVNERHMYNQIKPKRTVSATETLSRIVSRGRGDLGFSLTKVVGKGMNMLLKTGVGSEKEIAADQSGALYVAQVGYEPGSLLTLLKRIGKASHKKKAYKTHPPFQKRNQALIKFFKGNGISPKIKENAILQKRFQRVKRKVSSQS